MKIAREVRELAPTEKAQYYKKKWDEANVPLNEGEYAVQMVNHSPYYFITNQARVFSVYQKKYRELKQCNSVSKNLKRITCGSRQLRACLIQNGRRKTFIVSHLINEYFDIPEFNPMDEGTTEIHHKQEYDEDKGEKNNWPENLQRTGAAVHKKIFTPIQKAVLTDGGLQVKNPKQFYKSMDKIHGDNSDAAFMILSRINADGTVKSVEGKMLTDQDISDLLKNGQVQVTIQSAYLDFMQRESERRRRLAEYIREHPERVCIVDGEPVIIEKGDTEDGMEKEQEKKKRVRNTEHRDEVQRALERYNKRITEIRQADLLNELPEGRKDELIAQAERELGQEIFELEAMV